MLASPSRSNRQRLTPRSRPLIAGLTRRARVVYASKERVKLDTITYEDLADPKWRGKSGIRSGQHVYNAPLPPRSN